MDYSDKAKQPAGASKEASGCVTPGIPGFGGSQPYADKGALQRPNHGSMKTPQTDKPRAGNAEAAKYRK